MKALGKLRELASFSSKMVKDGALPGGLARRARPRPAADPHLLARRRRPLHHAAAGLQQGPGRPARATAACTASRRLTRRTAMMHWQIHKDGAAHLRDSQGRVPVAVVIGSHPATTYSATAPLPPGIDEMIFAGFLRGKSVEMVKCRTVDLEVPAEAEIVLEGYVDAERPPPRGPLRRPHRLLHAGRRLPDVPPHGHVDAPRRRSTRRPSSGRRRWRTSSSARPPSASSCRSSG